ncbi:efflux RND transporter periplasmic adaptor subunit [Clostridium pasteurianum]|uniref:Multidrug resistance efflux pump n=1 Tax=Clostridium pasteurianum BC1 TaxID=86416 RepID=R4KIM2_CLOPA|nr:efflux RND transporter periplasmic adaptor subunit [Clostridium pasteurianum]AGK99475.1 multidrug resistance efflux pump [Clostridium pasteurianum BC1]
MKKGKISLLIISIGLAVALTACQQSSSSNTTKKPAAKQNNNTIEASGTVQASNVENIIIDFPTTAIPKITKINVQEGQQVKKGDKLVQLDMNDYNATVKGKQKAVDADISAKNADVESKKDLTTDNAKNAYQAKIDADQDKIDADQIELNALKAKLNRTYLNNEGVVSDIDNAVVTNIAYKVGDLAAPEKALLSLSDLNSLYVQANVSEEFIKDVAVGKAVQIVPNADPSAKITGKVTSVANAATLDKNGDTYIPVNISIDQNNGKLLPNYNVDVQIDKSK